METKKFVLSFLALFTLVVLTSFVSAATNFTISDIVVNPPTASPGETFTSTFNLINTNGIYDLKDISITFTDLDNKFEFKSATIGGFVKDANGDSVDFSSETTIENMTSKEIVLTFEVNAGVSPKSYLLNFDLNGTINGTEETQQDSFFITVDSAPSFKFTKDQDLSQTQNGTFDITNTGNVPLSLDLSEDTDFGVDFSTSKVSLNPGKSLTNLIEVFFISLNKLVFGSNVITVKAEDATNQVSGTLGFTVDKTFCSNGEQGSDLEIKNVNVDNNGAGKDDEWQLLDTVEVEVEIKNLGNDNIKDIFVELGLFDSNGNDVTGDLNFDNTDEETIDVGRLNDGDREKVTFKFTVPADMSIEKGYMLAIKTYSDDLKEQNLCADTSSDLSDNFYDSIEIKEDPNNNIAIDTSSVVISPEEPVCGENVFLNLDAYNIGGNGEEEQTKVRLRNSELNLDMDYEIRNNMDDGDKEPVDFSFTIPKGIEAKTYSLEFSTFYDYRSGTYRESSDDVWLVPLKVISCDDYTTSDNTGASIFASLASDAVAGNEMTVDVTIVNKGTESAIFIVDVSGYESWGSLNSFTRSVQIGPGESKPITLTFELNKDAEGTESFIIQTTSNEDIETQNVEFSIEGSTGAGFTGLSIFGSGNANVWILVTINVVLILLIILVAVKLSRR